LLKVALIKLIRI